MLNIQRRHASSHNKSVDTTPHQVLPRCAFSVQRYRLEDFAILAIICLFLFVPSAVFMPRVIAYMQTQQATQKQETALSLHDKAVTGLVLGSAFAETPAPNKALKRCTDQRASLTDRHNNLLGLSIDHKSEFIIDGRQYRFSDPKEVRHLAQTLHAIVRSKPVAHIERALLGNSRRVISAAVSPAQVAEIRALEGPFAEMFVLTPVISRLYPQGKTFGHIIGYVNDDLCPANGLERHLNTLITEQEEPVALSLDSDLQYMVTQVLRQAMQKTQAKEAFTYIVNIHTGEILSEVSLPTFDPNKRDYFANMHPQYWRKISKNAIDRPVELGSLLKIVNTALALENGMTLDRVFDTTNPLYTNGTRIAEPFRPRFDYSITTTFLKSSNWGSARMALDIGGQRQRDFLLRFGLGQARALNADMSDSRTANLSFGYGVQISLKQSTAAMAALLNGGRAVDLTYQRVDAPERYGPRVYSPIHSHMLGRLLLTNVVHPEGTGKAAYHAGVMLGGKTGTAKIANPSGRGYLDDTRASFIGVFPAHQPRYIIATMLVNPRDSEGEPANAGQVTAPVVGEIAKRMAVHQGMLLSPEETKQLEQQYVLTTQFDEIRLAQQ